MEITKSPLMEGSGDIIPCGYACEALSFLQQIYHSAPVGMMAVNSLLRIIRINQRMADFAGIPCCDCPEMALGDFLPEAAQSITLLAEKSLSAGEALIENELNFLRNGNEFFWIVSIYPVKHEYSGLAAANIIVHDISELHKTRKKLEKALQDVNNLQEKIKLENAYLRQEIATEKNHIIGQSPSLIQVMHQLKKVAPSEATVLITGDTGTGKELAAREIHRLSRRSDKPFVVVNCAAMPANLIESELFGHEKGSFTGAVARKTGRFEVANGGTIFLDEIGEMPLELQSKLLRVLQENQIERIGSNQTINIDVRVLAATNRDLAVEVNNGRFREDLFYRLNVFPIHLPALSQRGEDVIAIALEYMKTCATRNGKMITSLSDQSKKNLLAYNWPGNIRELRNVVERAVILCQTDTLEIEFPGNSIIGRPSPTPPLSERIQTLHEVEKTHILKILDATSWRIRGTGGAAEILAIKPTTLESRMAKLGIKRAGKK